jgi:hypothetical protein
MSLDSKYSNNSKLLINLADKNVFNLNYRIITFVVKITPIYIVKILYNIKNLFYKLGLFNNH